MIGKQQNRIQERSEKEGEQQSEKIKDGRGAQCGAGSNNRSCIVETRRTDDFPKRTQPSTAVYSHGYKYTRT